MDYVAVQDPFADQKKENDHPHIMHIFESNLPTANNRISDDIGVYQSTAGPMSLRASKLDGLMTDDKSSASSDP